MKTSTKIILAIAGFVIVYLVISMVVLRNKVLSVAKTSETKYKTVLVNNFEALDFEGHWSVKIKQGREHKVEVAIDQDSTLLSKLKNIDGTLYFNVEETEEKEKAGSIKVNITTPSLRSIKAKLGTTIHLKNFKSDSIWVVIEDSGAFTGEENQFIFTSFKTSGNVNLQIIDDPYQ
jgi:hypothetical protein